MGVKLKPLSEQVVVLTGATSGIGLATARRFAKAGARLMLVARSEEDLRNTAEELRAQGAEVEYFAADVGEREQMEQTAQRTIERFGGFDTWVNVAGVGVYAKLSDISDEDHHRLFQTNYWGVVYGSLAALPHLKERGGALINIGSIASDMPSPLLSAYAASKHAVKGFTDSLRLELIHEKAPISVTLIKPSGIDSPFGDHARNYMDAASRVPPPVYSPELVADAILHAAHRPTREVTVGGSGIAMVAMSRYLPNVADQVFASTFFKLARDDSRANTGQDTLFEGGDGGRVRGEAGFVRKTSIATAAQTHPRVTLTLMLAAAAAGAALVWRAQQQRRSEHDDDDRFEYRPRGSASANGNASYAAG